MMHSTQYLLQLVREGRLKLAKDINLRVTYHDPCYLGRHNEVYDEPRELLESIPGVELVEMADNRESSLCCGGGGGRIWQESVKGERLSDLRVEQALETGAQVLAIACPYCMQNFLDSVISMGKEDVLRVADISELVLEAL